MQLSTCSIEKKKNSFTCILLIFECIIGSTWCSFFQQWLLVSKTADWFFLTTTTTGLQFFWSLCILSTLGLNPHLHEHRFHVWLMSKTLRHQSHLTSKNKKLQSQNLLNNQINTLTNQWVKRFFISRISPQRDVFHTGSLAGVTVLDMNRCERPGNY